MFVEKEELSQYQFYLRRKFLMHVDDIFDNCPVCKYQFLELCIHDYFYNHRRERKEEGKRKDGCLVNDDNNKTETQ
jgi:hypothetical protein